MEHIAVVSITMHTMMTAIAYRCRANGGIVQHVYGGNN